MTKELKHNIIITLVAISIFYFLYLVRSILLPFILGGLVAYFAGNITTLLEKRIKSREVASILVVSLFSIIILLFFAFVIPLILDQSAKLIKELAEYLSKNDSLISDKLSKVLAYFEIEDNLDFKKYVAGYSKNIATYFMGLINNILSRSIAFITIMSLIIITPITAYYFLSEWNNMIAIIKLYLPKKNSKKIEYLFKQIDSVLSACVKGQFNVCLILSIFYGTLLMFSGLKYGFIIGLITGIASFIPYFGMITGFIIAMIMAFYQFGFSTTHIFIVIGIFVSGQILEGNFITPKLVGNKINLHPLWIIFAIFSGGTLFGFVGLLIALPTAGIIGVLIRFYIKETIENKKNERKIN